MERIEELLARLTELTAEELVELEGLLNAEADVLLDAEPTDEVVKALAPLSESIKVVRAENQRRADVATANAAERDRLAAEIRGADDDESADAPPADEPADADEDADAPSEQTEQVAVTAAASDGGTAAPRPVAVPRPASSRPRTQPSRVGLTAAANLPGVQGGKSLDDDDSFYRAISSAVDLAMTASGTAKICVATAQVKWNQADVLGRDAALNERIIDKRVGRKALAASGGICSPIPITYDLPIVGDQNGRPVRDALARFAAERGGSRFLTPPTIDVVSNTTTGPVSLWTEANDTTPASPLTKPYLTISCDNTETVTKVNAIPLAFKIGNFRDKWYPEQVAAYKNLGATFHARYAESLLLKAISDGSKNVTHGQVLGAAQDVFTALRQLIAGMRYRHRIPRGVSMRVIGFEWARDMILTDLVRKGRGDLATEARLRYAVAELDSFFSTLGCNVTWSNDFQNGRTVGQTGGPLAGTQGVNAVIGYPSIARFYVFIEGSWMFLDGGELNLGVIRDATLVGTNDMLMFQETFENAAYHGVPGETYTYDIDIAINGAYANGLDISTLTSSSGS